MQQICHDEQTAVGKVAYIHEQFHAGGYQTSQILSGTHHRFISSSDHGQCGCEIWVIRTHPYGYADFVPLCFQPDQITMQFAKPRFLLLTIIAPGFSAIVGPVHAPHLGYAQDEKVAWWAELTNAIKNAFVATYPYCCFATQMHVLDKSHCRMLVMFLMPRTIATVSSSCNSFKLWTW